MEGDSPTVRHCKSRKSAGASQAVANQQHGTTRSNHTHLMESTNASRCDSSFETVAFAAFRARKLNDGEEEPTNSLEHGSPQPPRNDIVCLSQGSQNSAHRATPTRQKHTAEMRRRDISFFKNFVHSRGKSVGIGPHKQSTWSKRVEYSRRVWTKGHSRSIPGHGTPTPTRC